MRCTTYAIILAAAFLAPTATRAGNRFLAIGLTNLGPPRSSPGTTSEIRFYNLDTMQPAALVESHGATGMAIAACPRARGFLLGWSPLPRRFDLSALRKATTVFEQYDPASRRATLKRVFPWVVLQGHGGWQRTLVAGPRDLVWALRYRLHGRELAAVLTCIRWRTGAVTGNFRLRHTSLPGLFALKGRAVLIYGLGNRPQIVEVLPDGTSAPVPIGPTITGVPRYLSAKGDTLYGLTKGGSHFVTIHFGPSGNVVREAAFPLRHGWSVNGFDILDAGKGVALVCGPGGLKSRIIFTDLATGAIQARVKVPFPAAKLITSRNDIFLVSDGGTVAQCNQRGAIVRVGVPPQEPVLIVGSGD